MGITHQRYQAANDADFCQFLTGWLETLPRSGWSGTAADLSAVWHRHSWEQAVARAKLLDAEDARRVARLRADPSKLPYWKRPPYRPTVDISEPKPHDPNRYRQWFPIGPAVSRLLSNFEQTINEAGWALSFSRTSKARLIHFTRAKR